MLSAFYSETTSGFEQQKGLAIWSEEHGSNHFRFPQKGILRRFPCKGFSGWTQEISDRHDLLAVGGITHNVPGTNNDICIWNMNTGRLLNRIQKNTDSNDGASGDVVSLSFHPTEKLLASATEASVQLWDLS